MRRTLACLAALAFLAGPAAAHHGTVQYDFTKPVTLTGQVKNYTFGDPHIWLWIDVAGAGGRGVEWSLEGPPLRYGQSRGWRGDTIKRGDKVSVSMAPLKDGSKGGIILTVADAAGKVVLERGRNY